MFVIQKSVAEMIMKSRDLSKLKKVQVTDKNGKTRTVYKKTTEEPKEEKGKKPAEEKPVDTKKYSDMLDKVKNGPEENALFVRGKGMLNKKDAIAYLEEKTGKKTSVGTDAKESKVESKKTVGQKMAYNEDKAFEESEKNARKKYGDMSIEELEEFIAEKSKANRYSPEYREAMDANDILQEKKKEAASKGTESKTESSNSETSKRTSRQLKDDIYHGKYDKYIRAIKRDADDPDLYDAKQLKKLVEIINKDGNSDNVDTDSIEEALYDREDALNNGASSPFTSNEDHNKAKNELSNEGERAKPEVSMTVKRERKKQQDAERARYEKDKQLYDFYKNTGLPGGTDFALAQGNVEKEENKQANLKAGNRDDSIFDEGDDVTFWRSGNYIDGKISKVTQDYRGIVSLQIESDGKKYWVETDNIIKHPASAK